MHKNPSSDRVIVENYKKAKKSQTLSMYTNSCGGVYRLEYRAFAITHFHLDGGSVLSHRSKTKRKKENAPFPPIFPPNGAIVQNCFFFLLQGD